MRLANEALRNEEGSESLSCVIQMHEFAVQARAHRNRSVKLRHYPGPVTVGALETILTRSTVPILRQIEERQPELMVALLPSLVRTMLAAFVEVMAVQSA